MTPPKTCFLMDIRKGNSSSCVLFLNCCFQGVLEKKVGPSTASLVGYMGSKAELKEVSIFLDFVTYLDRLL